MKMVDASWFAETSLFTIPYTPLFLSEHSLSPALFIIYTILIGVTLVICVLFLALLALNRNTFHFSFEIILAQAICCGFCKIMTRCISYFGFGALDLYAMELMFDFGLLLFISLMTVNRLLVVSTPPNCFIYSIRTLQCIFVLILWMIAVLVLIAFRTGKCLRYVEEDNRVTDTCFDLLIDSPEAQKNLGPFLGSIFFIRKASSCLIIVVLQLYNFLPIFCLALYFMAASILMLKRRGLPRISSHRSVEWRIVGHGFVIFVVYGISNVIDLIFELNRDMQVGGALAQAVVFVYISLDVFTVLLIPLSLFLTVPALRNSPRSSYEKWRKQPKVLPVQEASKPQPTKQPNCRIFAKTNKFRN